MDRILLGFLLVISCGCTKITDTYIPPIDRKPLTQPQGDPLKQIAEMGQAEASGYVVRDISPPIPKAPWRWTGKRPELRFILYEPLNRKFVADFAIPEVGFRETGPVTVSFFINDHLLETVRCDGPGVKHVEKPVPPEWLKGMIVRVAAEVDKQWALGPQGEQVGVLLFRAGFTG